MTSPSANGEDRGRARDGRGRFTRGNPGGPGNPHAPRVAQLRAALLEAVTVDDVREVLLALIQEAKAGNVQAIKLFLDRTLGQPEATDVLVRLEELEEALERSSGRS